MKIGFRGILAVGGIAGIAVGLSVVLVSAGVSLSASGAIVTGTCPGGFYFINGQQSNLWVYYNGNYYSGCATPAWVIANGAHYTSSQAWAFELSGYCANAALGCPTQSQFTQVATELWIYCPGGTPVMAAAGGWTCSGGGTLYAVSDIDYLYNAGVYNAGGLVFDMGPTQIQPLQSGAMICPPGYQPTGPPCPPSTPQPTTTTQNFYSCTSSGGPYGLPYCTTSSSSSTSSSSTSSSTSTSSTTSTGSSSSSSSSSTSTSSTSTSSNTSSGGAIGTTPPSSPIVRNTNGMIAGGFITLVSVGMLTFAFFGRKFP